MGICPEMSVILNYILQLCTVQSKASLKSVLYNATVPGYSCRHSANQMLAFNLWNYKWKKKVGPFMFAHICNKPTAFFSEAIMNTFWRRYENIYIGLLDPHI